ncbi:hypothetical protein [Ochrobactrum sp. EDr1-4]|uniref:hypothetical protein n=1 Tax=Ochrobactrum sp. EDr1-4 TaxID=3368622 RepID=UPI003B9EAB77
MALRQPFTMQFAHDQIDAKYWGSPKFQRKNYVMTGVWALIFLVMAGVKAIVGFGSDLSVNMGTVLVLISGIWYMVHKVVPNQIKFMIGHDNNNTKDRKF